jgi:hypothetical protein
LIWSHIGRRRHIHRGFLVRLCLVFWGLEIRKQISVARWFFVWLTGFVRASIDSGAFFGCFAGVTIGFFDFFQLG